MNKDGRKPPAMPDDTDLFRQAMGNIKPVKGKEKIPTQPVPAKSKPARPITAPPTASALSSPGNLAVGQQRGVDSANFERFRRGEMAIDAKLDLHGMTQDKAFIALQDFIGRNHRSGKRCVLIITGKGKNHSTGGLLAKPGVLRENLPGWLNHPALNAKILAIHQAQPKHGGSGAFYVLLKRNRE